MHLIAVVTASAAGDVLPPFFFFEGKHMMQNWLRPLSEDIWDDCFGVPTWFKKDGWFDVNSSKIGIKDGFMESSCISFVIHHIRGHIKGLVPDGKPLPIMLDGLKSRCGWEWLTKATAENIEVVQLPENTTHSLHPSDKSINKAFQTTVRKTRDLISQKSMLDFSSMNRKLILGISGYRALTKNIVKVAFINMNICPSIAFFWSI